MSPRFNVRLTIRELRQASGFASLLVLNLTLGLLGVVALMTFETAALASLAQRSKTLYGADLGTYSRRPLSEQEQQLIESTLMRAANKGISKVAQTEHQIEHSHLIELYSMVADASGQSRLVRIKSIDEQYPLYGQIEIRSSQPESQRLPGSRRLKGAWLSSELLIQLGVAVGDELSIGQSVILVEGEIIADSTAELASDWAPLMYVSHSVLAGTGLLQHGSIAGYADLYKVPGVSAKALEGIATEIFDRLAAPDIKMKTHQTASEQLARWLTLLNDFLGLGSLVALFLSAIATGYLSRSYLNSKVRHIAILRALGVTPRRIWGLYSFQLMCLGVLSAGVAVVLGSVSLPLLGRLLQDFLPIPMVFRLTWPPVLVAVWMGVLGSFLVALPFLWSLQQIKPVSLLGDAQSDLSHAARQSGSLQQWVPLLLGWVPAGLCFWLLSVLQAESFTVGSIFFGVCVLSCVLLAAIYDLLWVRWAPRLAIRSMVLRWALRDLARYRISGMMIFISLGLGVILLNILPQLNTAIVSELSVTTEGRQPDLFMFDIQSSQVSALRSIVEAQGASLITTSPMVRGRLVSVNGQPFDKGKGESAELTREAQAEARFRNRGVNLSYRDKLSASERLILGQWWQGSWDRVQNELPMISLEDEYAKRLGLKLSDTLVFDIEGIEISGRVASIRKVKWGSFQPNFFIVLQPGVLDLAPKTFLATAILDEVSTEPLLDKAVLQNRVVAELPNITIIDVARLVSKLLGWLEQMRWALQSVVVLCILAGLMVLYSIVNYQAQLRRKEIAMYKALGASLRDIQLTLACQFGLLAALAGIVGGIVGIGFSGLLSVLLFNGTWSFDISLPVGVLLSLLIITAGLVQFSTRGIFQISPVRLLG